MNRRKFIKSAALGVASTAASAALNAAEAAREPRPPNLKSHDPQVRALMSQLTLEEKVGQMVQAEQSGLKDVADIENYFLGSVLSGGSSDPKSGNGLVDWTNLYDSLQSRTRNTAHRIPILYGIDAVHGHNNVLDAVIFPHNIGLGCTRNAALVERAARITAGEVRATGINWTFAPCVTVPRDERWGRTYEGFGEAPALASEMGAAAVRGLQGNDLSNPLSVLACAKHFVGDGGTTFGTSTKTHILDRGDTQLGETELRRVHMQGYIAAIRAGVGSIMPSYSSWNGVKCSGSKRLLTEILKRELGFEGFLISDYDAIDEMPGDYKMQIETSVNAGMDMFMVPTKYRELYRLLLELVREQRVPMSRIDDAVLRILRVKFAMGLMNPTRSTLADRTLHKTFGSRQRREVARECVRQSLVLLKNSNRILPLAKNVKRLHVCGKSADDLGNQCGGWTIGWQGKSGNVTSGGTTVLQAIRASVSTGTQVTFSRDGADAAGADVTVAVIGETPYAEMLGDRKDLNLASEDMAAIARIKQEKIPLVVILLSGRPMIINEALAAADAFIAAWLPGTEARGITDILFGDYKPTGKLSHSWPRSMEQVPINVGDRNYNPLFPYGFGLMYD